MKTTYHVTVYPDSAREKTSKMEELKTANHGIRRVCCTYAMNAEQFNLIQNMFTVEFTHSKFFEDSGFTLFFRID